MLARTTASIKGRLRKVKEKIRLVCFRQIQMKLALACQTRRNNCSVSTQNQNAKRLREDHAQNKGIERYDDSKKVITRYGPFNACPNSTGRSVCVLQRQSPAGDFLNANDFSILIR